MRHFELSNGELWCLVVNFAMCCVAFGIGASGWPASLIHAILG